MFTSLFSACSKQEIKVPFSDFYEDNASTYEEVTLEPSLLTPFSTNIAVVPADCIESVPLENAGAGLLIDVNNQEALFAQNVFDVKEPASITKIMTAICAVKYSTLDSVITCSGNVVNLGVPDAVVLGLHEGDTFTLDQALRLMLLSSYNDLAVAIAEHVSGSVEAFTELMNQEALSLGATSTIFGDPHGLYEETNFTSAYDLYLIFNEAIKYPVILEIIQSKEFSTNYKDKLGNEHQATAKTTNRYANGSYELPENVIVVGGKTGTTDNAGYCLMLLARDMFSNPYISIILQDNSRDNLYEDMTSLLSEINK